MDNTLALIANMSEKNLDFVQQILNTYTQKVVPTDESALKQPRYFVGLIDDEEEVEET